MCRTKVIKGTKLITKYLSRTYRYIYFNHYNVERIRPYEPELFDYEKEKKTNLLLLSEGLGV